MEREKVILSLHIKKGDLWVAFLFHIFNIYSKLKIQISRFSFSLIFLGLQGWKENNIANIARVGQKHGETVNT